MSKEIYGIIGHPVRHSLSPAMQNAALKACGIYGEYRVFDVEPAGLDNFLKEIASKKISGLNVTIPHKIKAKEYIEKSGSLDENAKRLGAVNTIEVANGRLEGHNTDGPGFYRSLVGDLKFKPEKKEILILGAGGAAHAIVMYLGKTPKRIYVFDVDDEKVEELKDRYRRYYGDGRLVAIGAGDLKNAAKKAALLVNATPLGMNESDPLPIDTAFLHEGLSVYDLVYNRPVTELVRKAISMKLAAVTGLGMLLYQGAISFEIWTRRPAPLGVMRKALRAALKSRGLSPSGRLRFASHGFGIQGSGEEK